MKNNENNKVLPRGYMIPNVDNKEDYAYFKVKIFRSVPKNTVLVCKNVINGNYYSLDSGLRVVAPWVVSKLTSLSAKTIDYPKEVYKTKDGIEVTVDVAANIRITDAVKYEIVSQTPLTQLGIEIKDLMRTFVAGKDTDDLYLTKLDTKNIDPNNQLDDFENKYGLKVEKMNIKNVILPRSIVDDYEKKKEAEKRREIALIEADEQKIRANTTATVTKIEGEAKASVKAQEIDLVIESLLKRGYSKEQIIDYMAKTVFAKDGTHVFANLNSTPIDGTNLGALGAVTSTLINDEQNTKTRTKTK